MLLFNMSGLDHQLYYGFDHRPELIKIICNIFHPLINRGLVYCALYRHVEDPANPIDTSRVSSSVSHPGSFCINPISLWGQLYINHYMLKGRKNNQQIIESLSFSLEVSLCLYAIYTFHIVEPVLSSQFREWQIVAALQR